jgi:hypothetical protein
MALSRRLSRVERELDPRALFLHWLAEAHARGSIEAYARWLAQQPDAADPFHHLLDRIEAAIRKAHGKDAPAVVHRELTRAHREASVAAHVFVRLNIEAEERLTSLGLIHMALLFWLRELTLRDALVEHGETVAGMADAEGLDGSWRHWQEAANALVTGLYETGMARQSLEDRYLSGHASLFQATAESWRDLTERCEGLHEIAMSLRDTEGYESLDAVRENAAPGAQATAERLIRMASVVPTARWASATRPARQSRR